MKLNVYVTLGETAVICFC